MIDQTDTRDDTANLRLKEVIKRTGLSRSEIYRRMALGIFPRPKKLGPKINVWSVGIIRTFNQHPDLDSDAYELL